MGALLALTLVSPALAQDEFGDTGTTADDILGPDTETVPDDTTGLDETQQSEAQAAFDAAMAEGQALQEQGKWAEAVAKYQDIINRTRGAAPQPYLELGRSLAALKNNDQALQAFTQAILTQGAASVPGLVSSAHIERGKVYLEAGQYQDASDDFGNAVGADPTNPEAHYFNGRALLLQVLTSSSAGTDQAAESAFQMALGSFSKAIGLKPDYGEAYLDRGRVLLRLRQIDYAVEDQLKAVELMGASSEAAADLGFTYKARASFEAANPAPDSQKIVASYRASISSLDRFLASHSVAVRPKPWEPTDPLEVQPIAALLTRAETYIDLGDELGRDRKQYQLAIADCEQYLSLAHLTASERAQGHFTRGVAKRMLNDFPGAIDDFGSAIRLVKQTLRPYYPEAHLRRGIIYFHQGAYDRAITDFQEATINPTSPLQADPRAMLWLGLAYVKQNNLEMAVQSYTRAIAGYDDYGPAYVNRGLTYMKLGRYDRALNDFNAALRLDGSNQKVKRYRDQALRLTSR
jgi:tetratricopeptide (TPR) repeat protein